MSDLIDRQAAIDAIAHATFDVTISGRQGFYYYKDEFKKAFVAIRDKYIEALKALPSAEPEIVRCKDCKYYNPIGVCIEMSSAVCEDSFCCWAERRTDELSD